MNGITLSSEQIRNAPADVRSWIERQVIASQQPVAADQKTAPSTAEAGGAPLSTRATEPAPAGETVINGTEAVHGFLE